MKGNLAVKKTKKTSLTFVAALVVAAALVSGCSKKAPAPEAAPADELAAKAIALVADGKFAESLPLFEQALQLDPEHPRALCGMGTAKRETGEFDAAIELYEKAISVKPDYAICMDNLGIALMRTGSYDEAKTQFEKASATDPAYADAKFNLGVLFELYIKDIPAAVKAFEEYLALSKDEAKKEEVKAHLEQIVKEAGPR